MTFYLIALFFFAIFRGLHEGMINIMHGDPMHNGEFSNGVRFHVWHSNYHKIAVLRDMFAIWLGCRFIVLLPPALFVAGSFFIFWELTEIGYSVARWKTIEAYEHINFADVIDFTLTGWKAYALHIGRTILGITLLIGGLS